MPNIKYYWFPPLPPCPLCGADTKIKGLDLDYDFFLNQDPIKTISDVYIYCSHTWSCGYQEIVDDIIYNTNTGWEIKYRYLLLPD
jgi:hypothetical protein